MEIPVFKLPGIVKEKEDMSDFEGPLTLILQLLSKDKVEIRDISISNILDQYLAYLDEMEELNLDIASEFVAMASHLTYIKTKMLLSDGQEVTELEQLITSLEELQRGDTYLQIKEVAQTLSGMYTREALMMAGPPEYHAPDSEYKYVHISDELLEAIYRVVGKENLKFSSINTREPTYPERVVYPISEKIDQVVEKLKRKGKITVAGLFSDCQSRTELIATLVAVLELCRVGSVLISGEADNLNISYTGSGRETEITDFTSSVDADE
ncbi:MAG: segregation/condensation protein A [Oscillospiraceae bacterium]|nr:segregation/condensation protein A [Oscillospiraceae bacterium]